MSLLVVDLVRHRFLLKQIRFQQIPNWSQVVTRIDPRIENAIIKDPKLTRFRFKSASCAKPRLTS